MATAYDLIIIGTGAGGGTLARHLAPQESVSCSFDKQKLYDKLKSMLGHLGMHLNHLIPLNAYLKTGILAAGVAHEAGACPFVSDPKTSVLIKRSFRE